MDICSGRAVVMKFIVGAGVDKNNRVRQLLIFFFFFLSTDVASRSHNTGLYI